MEISICDYIFVGDLQLWLVGLMQITHDWHIGSPLTLTMVFDSTGSMQHWGLTVQRIDPDVVQWLRTRQPHRNEGEITVSNHEPLLHAPFVFSVSEIPDSAREVASLAWRAFEQFQMFLEARILQLEVIQWIRNRGLMLHSGYRPKTYKAGLNLSIMRAFLRT